MRRYAQVAILILLAVCRMTLGAQVSSEVPIPTYRGQALTLLADGHILATGGFDKSGKEVNDAYLVDASGAFTKLSEGLIQGRGLHTATALPDGDVLILGGMDGGGMYVRSMEIYNPHSKQFTPWSGLPLVARASHTATVLTDGRVAVIGGTGEGSSLPGDIQLWNFRTGEIRAQRVPSELRRQGHTAKVLSDGRVLIEGGRDARGMSTASREVYDPSNGLLSAVDDVNTTDQDQRQPFRLTALAPLDGASQVPVQNYVQVRLSRLANVLTINEQTISLKDQNGVAVSAQVSAAEKGRLLFLIPDKPLAAGEAYTCTLKGVADTSGAVLPETNTRFTTAADVDDGAEDSWAPDAAALAGDWGSRRGSSDWERLPPIHGPSGVTALAGQVLGLSGKPLAHVTLQIDHAVAESDNTGRFLLSNLSPGHHVLVINGQSANTAKASFGLFEAGVAIKRGVTNVLPYTIWMTRLDTEHAITIPSPTTAGDTVISTPLLPGLEFHLPAHTTIVDRSGKKITTMTITPIPLDKPPFPLPTGVKVPIYFTIQPGGSEIRVQGAGSSSGPQGGRLYYPNTYNEPAGTPYNFWNYDAAAKGWYIYGGGTVSADKKSIVPNPGVVVYELTGAMVGGGNAQPPIGGGGPDRGGDPVDLASGQFVYSKTDLAISDIMPIELTRTYLANDHYQRAFGIGATCNYDIFMVGDNSTYQYQQLIEPSGNAIRFNRTSPGTGWNNAVYASMSTQGPWYGATLTWVGFDQTLIPGADWILQTKTGMMYGFPEASAANDQVHQALTGIRDRNGNQILLSRDQNALISKITSPSGRYISLARDPQGRITQANDNAGRAVSYSYDSAGHLGAVTDVLGGVTSFAYNSNDQMTTITDPRNITYLTNQYDSAGRVTQQTQADGSAYTFQWVPSANVTQQWTSSGSTVNRYDPNAYEGYTGIISQVSVTDPGGYVRQVVYNNLGMKTSDTLAAGQAEQQTSSYQYFADNLLHSTTDALGRTSTYDYDQQGNMTNMTALAGTSSAVTYTAAYDQAYGNLLSATDPLGHTKSWTYDESGNLTNTQDALGHGSSIAYDSTGEPTAFVDAAGNTTQFAYYGGTLIGITDPLGAQTRFLPDALGRVVQTTKPNGAVTQYQFDVANRLLSVTDPQGSQTVYTYDANDNLLIVQDALSHVTQFSYDAMDRRIGTKDPLERTSSLTYDLRGKPVSYKDRKGQYTVKTFDGIGRPISSGYGAATPGPNATYSSTQTYQYDGGNRLTSIVDSQNGTISRTFDGLNRLTGEITPQGSISYSYDAAGRRLSAQANGHALTAYTYDDASHMIGLTQSATRVSISYDGANRRSTLTLPNGVTEQYGYDSDSRLQSISYAAQGASVGTLSYVYDAAGRRTEIDGSLANTNLPMALASASYDAANQLSSWDGIEAAYDANGNMTVDVNGNQYAWNSRDQLIAISGSMTASFSYDALGRRTIKQVGSVSTAYQYDGLNRIVETSGEETAALLPGSLDEYFLRTDSGGSQVPIVDALGSTRGLVSSSGQLSTSYWYDPYGFASAAGTASNNSTTYAGRESDGAGLIYDRARYYNARLGRFLSEDPLGYLAGLNKYEYASSNPITWNDPFGYAPGDKWYGFNNRDFQDWFHKNWKQPGDPDAGPGDMQDAYDTWEQLGKPKRDPKGNRRSPGGDKCEQDQPEPADPTSNPDPDESPIQKLIDYAASNPAAAATGAGVVGVGVLIICPECLVLLPVLPF